MCHKTYQVQTNGRTASQKLKKQSEEKASANVPSLMPDQALRDYYICFVDSTESVQMMKQSEKSTKQAYSLNRRIDVKKGRKSLDSNG